MLLAPYPMTSYVTTLWRSWLGEVRVTWRSPFVESEASYSRVFGLHRGKNKRAHERTRTADLFSLRE
jgi:hypothetical protein